MPAATETVVTRVVQEVRQELVKTARRPAKDADAAKAREAVAALEASNGQVFCRMEFPFSSDSFIQHEQQLANGIFQENLENAKTSQIEQILQTLGNIVTLTKGPVAMYTHNKHEPAALQVDPFLACQNGKGKTKCHFL
jgi:hypothetical protein